ncbi:hypothetical protein J7I94_10825 [Streptomyces sp. ISL-12]|uniref:hypothetical protein n=1 Tax=Streptomyces sp. ISL-12 TaxID=2819177 RepID=UPI001BEB1ABA|nr:hypothetical protein [Streptomyces sp. ISL-12]MBT2411051.1 hypothetical protein [Streptomyces sp. ISL-12]
MTSASHHPAAGLARGTVVAAAGSARPADHTRRRWLRTDATWPCAQAFTTCWQRRLTVPAVT